MIWVGFFVFVFILSPPPVILRSYSVPNEHFVRSFCDFSVFVGERNMFPPCSHPYEAYSFQRQSKSQAGGRVCVKVGKLFAPHNN